MNRLIITLSLIAILAFISLAHASAAGLAAHHITSDTSAPMPGSVLAFASSVSGAGIAGRYLFGRRQK